MSNTQFYVAAVLPTLAVLVGILLNHQRINDLSAQINARITDLRMDVMARLDLLREALRAELREEFRAELARSAAQLREEFRADLTAMAQDLRSEMVRMHAEVLSKFAELEDRVTRVEARG